MAASSALVTDVAASVSVEADALLTAGNTQKHLLTVSHCTEHCTECLCGCFASIMVWLHCVHAILPLTYMFPVPDTAACYLLLTLARAKTVQYLRSILMVVHAI